MTHLLRGLLRGAVAGAAGTAALDAATYLDMAVRGRGASSTPQETVETLAAKVHVDIPGDEETEPHRVSGIASLLGILTGVATGAAVGMLYAERRPPLALSALLVGVGAMAGSNGGMAALGISDPRTWSAGDWISDIVPHAAYGLVTACALELMD